jgi:hypothetical protein
MATAKRKKGFLSYAHEDREWANRLYADLTALGINVWYDQHDFRSDQSVDDQILNAIKERYFIVLLLSKTSVSKQGYIRKEVKLGLDMIHHLQPGHVFIIPARIEDCQPTFEDIPSMTAAVDLFKDWGEGIKRIDRLIPAEGDATDLEGLSLLGVQSRLADVGTLCEIAQKLRERNEILIFVQNALARLKAIDASVLSRKIRNMKNKLEDFAACMELHFVHACGEADPKTRCNLCGAVGSIVHGTIDMGGYSLSDYNDNYIVWCQECFSASYSFEIDYYGSGPLKFDYERNAYS